MIKISNDFHVSDKVSICKKGNNKNTCQDGTTAFMNIKIRNTWTCSQYLVDNYQCKVIPTQNQILVPIEHDGKVNYFYSINSSHEAAYPECVLGNWYVTATGSNDDKAYEETINHNPEHTLITLSPNSDANPKYTLSAILHSIRKIIIKFYLLYYLPFIINIDIYFLFSFN